MKKNILLINALFLLNSFVFAQYNIPIEIIKIYDGDTIKSKTDTGNKFNIRLFGIDCYETSKINRAYKQAYNDRLSVEEVVNNGLKAKKYLEELHSKVKCASFNFKGIDKYNRILGVLYFENENINQKLINENYCKVYEFKED